MHNIDILIIIVILYLLEKEILH